LSKKHHRRRKGSKRQSNRLILWSVSAVLVLGLGLWALSGNAGELPQEGKRIADFTATDVEGNSFQLSQAYKEGEVILVFYRGFF